MSHLGDRVSAFVDDELDPSSRDRAVDHLARCGGCRQAVDQERAVKARLRALPLSEPSAALLGSLFITPDRRRPDPAGPAPAERALRPGLVLAGAGSVSAGMFAVAFLVGGAGSAADPVLPEVSPPVGQFSAEFAGTTQRSPFSDPAIGIFPAAGPGFGTAGSR